MTRQAVFSGIYLALGWFCAPAAAVPCDDGPAPVCPIVNNLIFFLNTAGPIRLLDFETWPDGTPTQTGQYVTPQQNYTPLGVTFYPRVGPLRIGGAAGGRGLDVFQNDPRIRDWIEGEFVVPTSAVGITFSGGTTLFAYDANDALIASVTLNGFGGPFFLGLLSDTPIARVRVDSGGSAALIDDFYFNPVPEPLGAWLLGAGWLLVRPCKRRTPPAGARPRRGSPGGLPSHIGRRVRHCFVRPPPAAAGHHAFGRPARRPAATGWTERPPSRPAATHLKGRSARRPAATADCWTRLSVSGGWCQVGRVLRGAVRPATESASCRAGS